MAESLYPLSYLRDARLAGHATAATPAWLWQSDGRRILWANVEAAERAGVASPSALAGREFAPDDPAVAEIARLAAALPANGSPRLAALEVPIEGPQQRPMCLCSRLTLDDATPAVLVVATGAKDATMPLAERARRLIADIDAPVAVFGADGNLLHATASAGERMGPATLASLGAGLLASEAMSKGRAEGRTPLGMLRLDRIGRDRAIVLLATFPAVPVPLGSPDEPDARPAAPDETDEPQPPAVPERTTERRHPLRFVWQMEPDGRFTVTSDAFAALIGADNAAILGQPWIDVARKLDLDPEEQVSRAIDSRETWSGITVAWPVGGTSERLMVEMSGLPTFDRERTFLGYRGFGVCREAEKLIARARAAAAPASDGVAAQDTQLENANIVPFRTAPTAEAETPALSPVEHTAFRELARQLGARLKGRQLGTVSPPPEAQAAEAAAPAEAQPIRQAEEPRPPDGARNLMDRLPVGVLVYRINTPIYANRAFLKWSGDASLEAFIAAGGLDRLFLESNVTDARDDAARRLTLTPGSGNGLAESRLFSIAWEGDRAHALVVVPVASGQVTLDLRRLRERLRELQSIMDLSADGIVVINGDGAVIRLNHDAEILFGYESMAVTGKSFTELLAPASRSAASADLAALVRDPTDPHAGRQVTGHPRGGDSVALLMTLGRIATDDPTYCAVFRDIRKWTRTEGELLAAKQQAAQGKSDFLARVSHEIRTPLNAIIGFSEVMLEERLGPIDNARYRAYLNDIHASGEQLVSLLDDMLDLSRIEAGKLELTFDSVSLNELTQQCVALMQPQANRDRVIIRTSLAPGLPPIVADARSVRQILLNLLSNSIRFTGAGGQVIVSTAPTECKGAVLRIRDTGGGMSETEIGTALEPFQQIETSTRGGSGGTGFGLPLTKALAEANHAAFIINGKVNSGTLVEVTFPGTRAPGR